VSRAYQGVQPGTITDPYTRGAIAAIDTYLRDVSRDMSTTEPQSAATAAAGPSYVTIHNTGQLANERKLAVSTPLTLTDGGAGGSVTIGVSFAIPSIALGSAAAAGAASTPIRSDATIAAFDVTTPSALAAAAATGSAAFAARRDHVHIFPTTLQSTGTVTTLALTAAGAVNTLTGSVATLDFTGMTTIRPGATNTINFGSAARRWLSGVFGTGGLATTGQVTSSGSGLNSFSGTTGVQDFEITGTLTGPVSGVADNWIPAVDATYSLGGASTRWVNVHLSDGVVTLDTSAAFTVKTVFTSSSALTANRTLTMDMANGSRTLKLTGNPTLADWFDQSVKTAASPSFAGLTVNAFAFTVNGAPTLNDWFDQSVKTTANPSFNTVKVLDSGTSFYMSLASNSAAPGGNFSADRTLTMDLQNADRTVTVSGTSHI
jgi:hypothetical protein